MRTKGVERPELEQALTTRGGARAGVQYSVAAKYTFRQKQVLDRLCALSKEGIKNSAHTAKTVIE